MRIGTTGRFSCASPPETNDRYPGTSGKTHGLANDTTPAANARAGAHHRVRPEVTLASGSRGMIKDGSRRKCTDGTQDWFAGARPPSPSRWVAQPPDSSDIVGDRL